MIDPDQGIRHSPCRSMDLLDQPCAFKLVYQPRDHYLNDHCLVGDAGARGTCFIAG